MIRLALAQDAATVAEIVHAAYVGYRTSIGTTPGPMLDDYDDLVAKGLVHVFEENGEILGLVVLIPEQHTMLLDNVAVRPRAQGRKLGSRLIAFAEQQARAAGYDRIRLYTQELMTDNRARYAHLGFIETHRAEEKGLKRIYMTKTLT
jgi:GNAT superfamily N-acetyltransferase